MIYCFKKDSDLFIYVLSASKKMRKLSRTNDYLNMIAIMFAWLKELLFRVK